MMWGNAGRFLRRHNPSVTSFADANSQQDWQQDGDSMVSDDASAGVVASDDASAGVVAHGENGKLKCVEPCTHMANVFDSRYLEEERLLFLFQ